MATHATTQTPFRMNYRPMEACVPRASVAPRPPRASHRPFPWIALFVGFLVLVTMASAVAVYSVPKFGPRPFDESRYTIKAIHAVAEAWRVNHGNECPTVQRLKEEKELASSTSIVDARGIPYVIRCTDEVTTVISSDARFPE